MLHVRTRLDARLLLIVFKLNIRFEVEGEPNGIAETIFNVSIRPQPDTVVMWTLLPDSSQIRVLHGFLQKIWEQLGLSGLHVKKIRLRSDLDEGKSNHTTKP
ncbi:MAG: hypothetical protein ACREGJ_03230 [Candidatus Saccharimonadales bacterium]